MAKKHWSTKNVNKWTQEDVDEMREEGIAVEVDGEEQPHESEIRTKLWKFKCELRQLMNEAPEPVKPDEAEVCLYLSEARDYLSFATGAAFVHKEKEAGGFIVGAKGTRYLPDFHQQVSCSGDIESYTAHLKRRAEFALGLKEQEEGEQRGKVSDETPMTNAEKQGRKKRKELVTAFGSDPRTFEKALEESETGSRAGLIKQAERPVDRKPSPPRELDTFLELISEKDKPERILALKLAEVYAKLLDLPREPDTLRLFYKEIKLGLARAKKAVWKKKEEAA